MSKPKPVVKVEPKPYKAPMAKMKFDKKTSTYSGVAAICIDHRAECEYIVIAPDTGSLQRAVTRITMTLKLNPELNVPVKVIRT